MQLPNLLLQLNHPGLQLDERGPELKDDLIPLPTPRTPARRGGSADTSFSSAHRRFGLHTREGGVNGYPTNNHAERTLRRAVIWRKVSFGNHSDAGCRFVECILTVTQTLRMQQRPVLDHLRQALLAHRTASLAPVLCPIGA